MDTVVRAASLALLALVVSCGDASGPAAYLEVRSQGRLQALEVWVKRYSGDRTTVVQLSEQAIADDRAGYVVDGGGSTPLRLRIDFPAPGSYAVHLVGRPVLGEPFPNGYQPRPSDRLADTRCYTISGEQVDAEVVLTLLTSHLDADGDTFPEDLEAFCTVRERAGIPCDDTCARPEFNALLDCNPPGTTESCDGPVPPNPQWHPFARDRCGDCLDQDCWGGDSPCEDRDGDGFPGDTDCDDDDPLVNPSAAEVCSNGLDENCAIDVAGCDDGDLPCDRDRDGALEQLSGTCGTDCDDEDGRVSPEALEGCGSDPDAPDDCPGCDDDIDTDCDGLVDEGCFPDDIDHDGVPAHEDCNDCNTAVGPAASERCGNGIDDDCRDGDLACEAGDRDRDGFESFASGGTDCDDTDPRIFPGAPDQCGDGIAQDCGGDVACETIDDGDGDRFSAAGGDCDDDDRAINPWAPESCDEGGVDEDCDGLINEVPDSNAARAGCGYALQTGTWYTIDYSTNPEHCGACRHRCCPSAIQCAGDTCVNGSCRCNGSAGCDGRVDNTCCPEGCVDLGSSVSSCGACGTRCARNERCLPVDDLGLGQCVCPAVESACPTGDWSACCDSGCVDLATDPTNCGSCGNDCTAIGWLGPRGDICALDATGVPRCFCGDAGVQCPEVQWCTDVTHPGASCGCANLATDPENCGTCGHSCDENETCRSGSCECAATRRDCGGTESSFCCPSTGCVDLRNDLRNCGGCGVRCASGQACFDGRCRCDSALGCDDGNTCTEDTCNAAHECEHHTLDADDDGWCAEECPDRLSGSLHDCTDGDCDDSDRAVNPDASETCSTPHDDDCDGDENDIDADGCTTYFRDSDHDEYGSPDVPPRCLCEADLEYSARNDDDCDDDDGSIYPGASESCNGDDDDCDPDTPDGADVCLGSAPRCCADPYRCCQCLDSTDCTGLANPDCVTGTCSCRTAGGPCASHAYCCATGCRSSPCSGG